MTLQQEIQQISFYAVALCLLLFNHVHYYSEHEAVILKVKDPVFVYRQHNQQYGNSFLKGIFKSIYIYIT